MSFGYVFGDVAHYSRFSDKTASTLNIGTKELLPLVHMAEEYGHLLRGKIVRCGVDNVGVVFPRSRAPADAPELSPYSAASPTLRPATDSTSSLAMSHAPSMAQPTPSRVSPACRSSPRHSRRVWKLAKPTTGAAALEIHPQGTSPSTTPG